MKIWKLGAALAATALAAGLVVRTPARAQGEVSWLSDFSAAQAEAQRTGKPLLVAFRCER